MRSEVLERRELSKGTKLRVFNAIVVPTLYMGVKPGLYRSDMWADCRRRR